MPVSSKIYTDDLGRIDVLGFVTRGRTRSCLYFRQEAGAVLVAVGMDCRHDGPGARDAQLRDVLPVMESGRPDRLD